jgi:selenocysteine lyase/cysteine desulfurase
MQLPGPEALRPHYSAFLRPDRILLTGHSHQAWPDVARAGLTRAFDDAAEHVDDKWQRAAEVADDLRAAVVERIGGGIDQIALGQSTHELVSRFLSALDLRRRPRLVTTSGEFHSLDRQLRRLAEEGVEVHFVDAEPHASLPGRLAAAIDERTAALLVSTVLFETSARLGGLGEAIAAAQRAGAQVLLDAYHAFNVVPFRIEELGPDPIFVTAGGYKYAQWGEGCCFLRVPPDTGLRPVYTGWFSDFAHLDSPRGAGPVHYGERPCDRFAGSTYDPSSHYRALAVAEFFREQGLSVDRLRQLSLGQTGRLIAGLDGFDVLTPRAADERGGFVALRLSDAAGAVQRLRQRGVWADARGDVLRLGPAPYTTDDEIDRALETLRQIAA